MTSRSTVTSTPAKTTVVAPRPCMAVYTASRPKANAAPNTSSASTALGMRLLRAATRTVCWSIISFRVST